MQARRRAVVSLVRGMIRRRRGGNPQPQHFASLKVENTAEWKSAGNIFGDIENKLQQQQSQEAQSVNLNNNAIKDGHQKVIKDGHQKVINTPLKQALPNDTVFYTGVSRKFDDRQYMVVKPGTA